MTQLLNITKTAGIQLKKIAENYNVSNILFYVKGGGCNGFNYVLEPLKENSDAKNEIVKLDNINIVICNSSIFHLLGTKIDWKKNIMGEAFYFENPNASSKCGCGTSFGL